MKIRERRTPLNHGMCGPVTEERVVELQEGQPLPAGAEAVPDETTEHDWQPVAAPAEE